MRDHPPGALHDLSPGYALLEGFLVALDAIGRVPEQEMRRNATGTAKRAQIGCCRKGSRAGPSGPPQFVEPGVGNAEMVSHLMDHRLGHDVEQLPLVLGDAANRAPENRDAVGHSPAVIQR